MIYIMRRAVFLITALGMAFSFQAMHSQDLQEIMGQLTNPAKKAEFKSLYEFDAYIRMEMSGGNEQVIYDSYLAKGGGNLAMVFRAEGVPTTVILDTDNEALVMLLETGGEKTGFAMAVNPDAIADLTSDALDDRPVEELKTGNTKTILGYSCNEYLIRDGTSVIRVWSSEKLGREIGQEIMKNQKVFSGAFSHAVLTGGMIMEYSYESEGESMVLKVTDLDLNRKHTISTSEYHVMSFGQAP
jgi:hypothetical protein